MDRSQEVVSKFAKTPDSRSMDILIALARDGGLDDEATLHLANKLAESGPVISWTQGALTADLASTGGPSSLSTLLAPLHLRAMGLMVPKLGVPGRLAGGIDVLSLIPDYKITFTPSEVRQAIEETGYVHFLADESFVPLDAILFRYRQHTGAQDIPDLAIASLLSKKIACGVKMVGLDVRVANHGNFGQNFSEARAAAKKFCRVAALAGIEAKCFLTDARFPYQPYIGRGEALVAIREILIGDADDALSRHNDLCRSMAIGVIPSEKMAHTLSIKDVFIDNLVVQGSSWKAFAEIVDAVITARRFPVAATRDGFVETDLAKLRDAFVYANKLSADESGAFPDNLGVTLRATPGQYVRRGDPIADIRTSDKLWSEIVTEMNLALRISDTPGQVKNMEEIV